MSRTDLDPACLVKALRRMAGDGGMEWCCEPIRASVLLDVADLLDENAKLRELVLTLYMCSEFLCWRCKHERGNTCDFDAENELRELGIEVDG